jgi:pSer/pThr/pTyr-binding forkhead associated (FHA) protein
MHARLVRYDSRGDIEQQVVLPMATTTVGRGTGNMVQVLDAGVSKRHAAIVYLNDRWCVQDLGSRNGVFVNGKQIKKPVELRNGDKIRFGPLEFEMETASSPSGWSSDNMVDFSRRSAEMTIQEMPEKESKLKKWFGLK